MRLDWIFYFVVLSSLGHAVYHRVGAQGEEEEDAKNYLNHWVVEVEGGRRHADNVAAQHGFYVDRQFHSLPDHYLLKKLDVPHRSRRSADHHTRRLSNDLRVKFVEQQHEKRRVKRDFIRLYNRALAGSIARSTADLNDPSYMAEWYINRGNSSDELFDMGVKGAWRRGVTGKGVIITIIDDGLEKDHPDLAANYEERASYDFNDNDPDPSPRYDPTNENKHGTRCGGVAAMVANNNVCGVGIAFNARIGGLRILDGKVTDHIEGDSLSFPSRDVDISSVSWGPTDDGKTIEGPGKLGTKGILNSILKGRKGKGTIMVWAAGNGASFGDNCNCDGYCSSIYTLTIGGATEHGLSPYYSEKCSSTLAATYSSGQHAERRVISADLHGRCTDNHSGTSAAAPMAAGILALVLEKNPDLTWRDVQHLVALTSRYEPLRKEIGWYRNGVGLCVSHSFGFGLMDADGLVQVASPDVWSPVGPQRVCTVTVSNNSTFPISLTSGRMIEVAIVTDGCKGQEQEINYLEHVQAVVTLDYSKRGNIYVELESPSGTITALMMEREKDKSTKGFQKWPLTSVHTWGENPDGKWIFRVADKQNDGSHGSLKYVELVLYGTKEKPFYHDHIRGETCAHLEKYPEIQQQEIYKSPQELLEHMFDGF